MATSRMRRLHSEPLRPLNLTKVLLSEAIKPFPSPLALLWGRDSSIAFSICLIVTLATATPHPIKLMAHLWSLCPSRIAQERTNLTRSLSTAVIANMLSPLRVVAPSRTTLAPLLIRFFGLSRIFWAGAAPTKLGIKELEREKKKFRTTNKSLKTASAYFCPSEA